MVKHFKYIPLMLACIAFFITICIAADSGYYIEEQAITDSPFTGKIDTTYNQIWVSGDKFRRNQGGLDEITIGRLDKGLFWIINLKDSTYSEVDLTSMRQLAVMSIYMMGAQMDKDGELSVPDDLYVRTGEKRKVGSWQAERISLNTQYANTGFIEEFSMWITKDLDAPANLYANMMRNIFGDPTGPAKKLLKMWSDFEGYPVLIEIKTMGIDNKIMTIKVEKTEVPSDHFRLPKGLTEIANPFLEQLKNMQNR